MRQANALLHFEDRDAGPGCLAEALHYGTRMTSPHLILLVEDDRNLRAVAADVLTASGFQVLTAPDAEAARDMWRVHGPIGLLLTDVTPAATLMGTNLVVDVKGEDGEPYRYRESSSGQATWSR